MDFYLVTEQELGTGKCDNVALFSTKEKVQKFIEAEGKSGDYYEYGITKFRLDNWEVADNE